MRKSVALLLVLVFLTASCVIVIMPVSAASPNSWTKKAPMPQGGAVYGAAVVNKKIYVFGAYYYNGKTYYTSAKYDPQTDTWTNIAPMPTPRIEFATASHANKIYVFGGRTFQPDPEQPELIRDVTEVYDPKTDSWTTKASMPTARANMQANVVKGKIYVIGGWLKPLYESLPQNTTSDVTEVYDPATDSWTKAISLPIPISHYASAVMDGKIHVMGGHHYEIGGRFGTFDWHQIYDPATDKWTFGAPLPKPVANAVGGATSGVFATEGIYVFRDGTHAYDTVTGGWYFGAPMIEVGYRMAAVVVDDLFYVFGGSYSEAEGLPGGTPTYNPPPPFWSFNIQYTPIGYGTFNPISSPESTATPELPPEPEPFPTTLVATAVVTVAAIGVGLLVYFKKRNR